MTTVAISEASTFGGRPIEGFRFIGAFKEYRYTSAPVDINIAGFTFVSLPMGRTFIRTGTHADDDLTLEVEMPLDNVLIQDYAFHTQPPTLNLELYRSHSDLDTVNQFIVYWKGPVTGLRPNIDTCTVRIPSVMSTLLHGDLPNRYWQNTCNNVLYDGRCKVVAADFDVATTITDISGSAITVASDGGNPSGFFNAGRAVLSSSGEERQIAAHVGTSITLVWPFATAATVTDAITLFAGCDLSYNGDCKTKFNNQINFGGIPYGPTDNPFEGQLV